MKAFQLNEANEFIRIFLQKDLFDNFLLTEARIQGAVCFSIDGKILLDALSTQEQDEMRQKNLSFMPFGRLRPICGQFFAQSQRPLSYKFVLQLSPYNLRNTIIASGTSISPDAITAAYLNLLFQKDQLLLTSGVSYRTFIPDKSFEKEWDRYVALFLSKNSIIFSEI